MPVSNVGNHLGEVVATGLRKAKTGNVQVLIQFRDEEGNSITAYLATTEKAWPYTEQKLEACGFVMADNDNDLTKLNEPNNAIIGMKEIPFVVEQEKDLEGVMRNKVSWIGEGAVGISERMSIDETKVFAAQLRARLVAKGGQKTSTKKTEKKGSPPPWER